MDNDLPSDVLRIVIDNTTPLRAEIALAWAEQTISFLREQSAGETEYEIVIRHLGIGSTNLELIFLGMGAVAAVGLFATAYAESLKNGDVRTSAPAVTIINNYRGTNVTICRRGAEPIVIDRAEMALSDEATSRTMTHALQFAKSAAGDVNPVAHGEGDARPGERISLFGRIVTTHEGRFAIFRTEQREYRIISPRELYEKVPIGEDLIVTAQVGHSADNISIIDWRLAGTNAHDEGASADNGRGIGYARPAAEIRWDGFDPPPPSLSQLSGTRRATIDNVQPGVVVQAHLRFFGSVVDGIWAVNSEGLRFPATFLKDGSPLQLGKTYNAQVVFHPDEASHPIDGAVPVWASIVNCDDRPIPDT